MVTRPCTAEDVLLGEDIGGWGGEDLPAHSPLRQTPAIPTQPAQRPLLPPPPPRPPSTSPPQSPTLSQLPPLPPTPPPLTSPPQYARVDPVVARERRRRITLSTVMLIQLLLFLLTLCMGARLATYTNRIHLCSSGSLNSTNNHKTSHVRSTDVQPHTSDGTTSLPITSLSKASPTTLSLIHI